MISTQTEIEQKYEMKAKMTEKYSQINFDYQLAEPSNKLQKTDNFVSIFAETPESLNEESVKEEILRYSSYPLSAEDLKIIVFLFWKKYKKSFPRLANFANFVHSIPATNLSSERNFNFFSLTITNRRASLDLIKLTIFYSLDLILI